MPKSIAVYCSSSNRIPQAYVAAAKELGRLLGEGRHELVYGGGRVGLMGVVAAQVHTYGGRVYGVIPERLKAREGIAYELADQLVVTETMQERKALMFNRAEAFVVLPGGFGTLEEFLEVLTLRQLGYHPKPIALLNTGGFFDPLLAFFDRLFEEGFARSGTASLYHLAATPAEALAAVA